MNFTIYKRKRKTILLVFLFITFLIRIVHAQDPGFKWAKESQGSTAGDSEGKAILSDINSNVFSINSIGNNNYQESFFIKTDSCGNMLWQHRFIPENKGGPKITSMTIDPAGYIYLAGYFFGSVDFDPGAGVLKVSTGFSTPAMFLCKFNTNGNLIWVKQIGEGIVADADGQFAGASPYALTTDNSGFLYTTGNFTGTVDFDPGVNTYNISPDGKPGNSNIFILKLDTDGNMIFTKHLQGDSIANAYSIAVDNVGNIYASGEFNNTIDFNPSATESFSVTSVGQSDAFIVKLNRDGNFIWTKRFGSSATELCNSLAADNNGNIYFKIFFGSRLEVVLDVDPGSGVYNIESAIGNRAVCKLNGNGDFQWVMQIRAKNNFFTYPEYNQSIDLDPLGNIYFVGAFTESLDFAPAYRSAGKSDVFILKLDAFGNIIWVKQFGGINNDGSSSISIDNLTNIYTTGYFNGIADMDPGPGNYPINSVNKNFNFIQKLSTYANYQTLNITSCRTIVINDSTYDKTGNYIQHIKTGTGCDSLLYINLTIGIPRDTVLASICEGQAYFAENKQQSKEGYYTDTIQSSSGCDSLVITHLKIISRLKPNLGTDRNLCNGERLTLNPGKFKTYLWSDLSSTEIFTVFQPGIYWVTVTDTNNCVSGDTISIPGIQTLPQNFLPATELVCRGSSVTINSPGYNKYFWSNGDTTSMTTFTSPGIFYLTVTDGNSCVGKDSILIQAAQNCIPISIPNAFTPNQDGLNDIFKPVIKQDVVAYSFIIYNRFGQKVFETTNTSAGWDGNFGNKNQGAGTFIYQINLKNRLGDVFKRQGTVTLIR